MRVLPFLCFFLLSLSCLETSGADSTAAPKVPSRVGFYFEREFSTGKYKPHPIDTSLNTIRLTNPALAGHYNYLGTRGSAAEPQIFRLTLQPFTYTGIRAFDLYGFPSVDIPYFQTNKRYTQVDWNQGAFKEQAIHVLHSQNITKGWNAGLDFTRLGVKDYMAFSRTFHSNLLFFTSYKSKAGRYNVFAHAGWLTIRNLVNGGVPDDSLFLFGNIANLDIKGLGYSLEGASQRYHRRRVQLSQYYTLRNRSDSLSPGVRLNYTFSAERTTYAYRDESPDSSFYRDFNYGNVTADTLYSDVLTNRFSLALPAGKRRILPNWNTEYYLRQQLTRYGMQTSSNWNNLAAGGLIQLLSDSGINLNVQGEVVLQGFDQGNILLQGGISLPVLDKARFDANVISGKVSADYSFRFTESNNFIWKQNFDKINFLSYSGGLFFPKLRARISVSQHVIDRWVVMNAVFKPEQLSKVVVITQGKLSKDFTFRKLHFDNFIVWQNSTLSAIRLPDLTSTHSLYIEKFLLKKAMLANFGFSLDFNSAYFSNNYMPSNSLFFLQNDIRSGGFARLDVFFNMRIKTARIFLLMENVGDNLTGNAYYLTPHHPMPGRVLKFGISWRFFD